MATVQAEPVDDPIFFKSKPATQAELTAAAQLYVPKNIPGGREVFSPAMDGFVHHVWGQLVLDGWTCNKEQVCVAVSILWDIRLTVTA